MVGKDTLLDALAKYRFLQKLIDEDEQRNYLRSIKLSKDSAKFLDGNGSVICELSLTGNGVAGTVSDDDVATDEEVNEMFDEILGGK